MNLLERWSLYLNSILSYRRKIWLLAYFTFCKLYKVWARYSAWYFRFLNFEMKYISTVKLLVLAISFRSRCWLFQIVYEGVIWCLFIVTFWGKFYFHIKNTINTQDFTIIESDVFFKRHWQKTETKNFSMSFKENDVPYYIIIHKIFISVSYTT